MTARFSFIQEKTGGHRPPLQQQSLLRLRFAGPAVCGGVFVQILDSVFVNEEIRLGVPGDSNDVFVVILNPATYLLAVDQFDDNKRAALREAIDVFGLAESRFGRGLPPIPPAGVFVWCTYCHAPQYSVFDDKIQE